VRRSVISVTYSGATARSLRAVFSRSTAGRASSGTRQELLPWLLPDSHVTVLRKPSTEGSGEGPHIIRGAVQAIMNPEKLAQLNLTPTEGVIAILTVIFPGAMTKGEREPQ
jgi:hypothetical protein